MDAEEQLPLFDDPQYIPVTYSRSELDTTSELDPTDDLEEQIVIEPSVSASTESGSNIQIAENAISLLALAEISGVGFATIRALFDFSHGQLSEVWGVNEDELRQWLQAARTPQYNEVIRQIKDRSQRLLSIGKERYYFLTQRRKTSILFRSMEGYPPQLLQLPQPPAWLFIEGDVSLVRDPAIVGVVGTRTPSEQGIEATKRLSVSLVRQGCVILSGLAEGIDEVGHRTAVDYGAPTIAVLGHGVNVVFPAATSGLRRHMVDNGGAVISEYLPDDSYTRERFVQRNRIQAALSHVVSIVEGQLKSGTAHTLRFARQLNRPVFGVRLGPPTKIAQQELLSELERLIYPVFELDSSSSREAFRSFLMDHLPSDLGPHPYTGEPRLFRGLLKEIKRLAEDYDALDEDFDWLVDCIQKLRSREAKKHAN